MEISRLIDALSRPDPYPHPAPDIVVHQTHISAVFLAGTYAYKLKKPAELGFLDFSTLERRRHYCHEEVRLNRRLAPSVYHGVVAVRRADGGLRVDANPEAASPDPADGGAAERDPHPSAGPEADEDVVDYMVRMHRLPGDATLLARLRSDTLDPGTLDDLAERLAAFHARARSGPEIARYGDWPTVAGNARENMEQTRRHVGRTVSPEVHARVEAATERCLDRLRPHIVRRARSGIPRDTHGDLHLDHVYLFPDRSAPDDIVVIDCIEFNERFRYADPVSDTAFLAMDLAYHGRRDLARRFARRYLAAAADRDGNRLLPFYMAYRSVVRAKVDGIAEQEPELDAEARAKARSSARAHWLLALDQLEPPGRRPGLVLVGGLPGTGKSTLAGELAHRAGFTVLSSDRVRKELAGLEPDASAAAEWGAGIYSAQWHDRTYAELARRATSSLWTGNRVVVDASFRERHRRDALLEVGHRLAVRTLFLECVTPPDLARARTARGGRGASDAGPDVYDRAANSWEPPAAATRRLWHEVPTGGPIADGAEAALQRLREVGLL